MKTIITFLFIFISGFLTHAQNTESSVLFKKDSYALTDDALMGVSEMLAEVLHKSKTHDYAIVITGHTDSDGSEDYNLKLSEKRMKSVFEYLVTGGIESSRISTDYFGELQPRIENSDEASMTLNRRVEILVQFKKKADDIETKTEERVVQDRCDVDTTIFLPKGTSLRMSICDFERNRVAILSSYEITTFEEILESGLSLETDEGEQLITGGMIKIGNDSTKFEKPVEVTMPLIRGFYRCNDSALVDRMRLYRANHDGDWSDQDSLVVGERIGTTTFTFNITQGGYFNCDAISFAPIRVLAQGASKLLSPIAKKVQQNRNTIRIKAPKGEKLTSVRILTECNNCTQPYISKNRATKYNKRRTKAKIKISCCVSDQVSVSYKLRKVKGVKTSELKDLKKMGVKKLANCGSSAGIVASIIRIFRRSPKVYRKYHLPAVST